MMNNWNETLSALAVPAGAPADQTPAGTVSTAMAMIATAAAAVTGTAGAAATLGTDAGAAAGPAHAAQGGDTADAPTHADSYVDFGAVLTAAQLAGGFVAPVGNLGLIAATGADAATFLHGQLTNDVTSLSPSAVRLAGYCTPKGRLQATMLMWRGTGAPAAAPATTAAMPATSATTAATTTTATGVDTGADTDTIYLQVPRAIQPAFQKRLSMFVMRAKAKLRDATHEPANEAVLGLGGARAEAALRTHVQTLPDAPNSSVQTDAGTVLRLADAFGAPRYLWLTSGAIASAALPALRETLALGGTDAWELCAIHAGIAQVTPATFEAFVPQMINYELVGGVNFKKGCYPGQEIVARSQYLGKLKRRTTLVTILDATAAAGMELFSLDDPAQPCGMVVNAAPNGAGGVDALVEIKLAALDQAVHLGSTTGAPVEFLPMPYVLDPLDV